MLRIFLSATFVALLLVLILAPAYARDIPFTSEHTVDGDFNRPSVTAALTPVPSSPLA